MDLPKRFVGTCGTAADVESEGGDVTLRLEFLLAERGRDVVRTIGEGSSGRISTRRDGLLVMVVSAGTRYPCS